MVSCIPVIDGTRTVIMWWCVAYFSVIIGMGLSIQFVASAQITKGTDGEYIRYCTPQAWLILVMLRWIPAISWPVWLW